MKDEKAMTKNQYEKGTSYTQTQKTRDIKCFRWLGSSHIASQCPNKRATILKDNGEITSEESEDGDSMPSLDDASDCEYAVIGEALVVMRELNTHIKGEEKDDKLQRENIFHSRCLVKDKVNVV